MAVTKLGVLGFGIMGERMVRACLDQAPVGIEIAAVWDPSSDAIARLKAELPAVPVADNIDAVLAQSDCIYIASPPDSHLDHARAAFKAGKAVLCEKPLSADIDDSRRFAVEAARQSAGVNFVFASSPAVAQLRAWIEEGAVGTPEQLDIDVAFASWPRPWQMEAEGWLSKRPMGGFTREVISHFLFLSRRLVGPLALLSHDVTYPDNESAETALTAKLRAGGVPITLTGGVGTTEKPDHNLWVLRGDQGSIRLRDWSVAERLANDGSWHEAPGAMANEDARPLVLKGQLEKVIALVAEQPQSLATVEEALEVQEIVETLLTE
jgi:predicted dehydrogenase